VAARNANGDPDDRTLVARMLRNRDEQAFGALYDRHTPYLYRFALRLTGGDEPLAEDVVHDAWLSAADALPRFEWRSELRTWLAAFVVQRARREWRHDARLVPLDALADVESGGDPVRAAVARIDLERAIATLAPGYRDVLVLHDIEDYTHDQIGELLGIAPGTSKSQLSHARAALRRALAPVTPPVN
jgi:RNA polymerase sigma-70 factor (ECF subfamily)